MNRVRGVQVTANTTGSFAFVECDILHLPPRTNGIAPYRTGPRVQRPKRSTADVHREHELFELLSTDDQPPIISRLSLYMCMGNFFFHITRLSRKHIYLYSTSIIRIRRSNSVATNRIFILISWF